MTKGPGLEEEEAQQWRDEEVSLSECTMEGRVLGNGRVGVGVPHWQKGLLQLWLMRTGLFGSLSSTAKCQRRLTSERSLNETTCPLSDERGGLARE